MSTKNKKEGPIFKGLNWHREQYFSLFIPNDWHKMQWQDERQGILFVPTQDDALTLFAIEVKDLGTTVTSDDLPYLATGFYDAIKALPERKIESKNEKVTGKLMEVEAKYTYLEDGQTRKRWVRLFYHETRQITVTAQGATAEKYDYWLPMFYEAMMTIKVHNTIPTELPV